METTSAAQGPCDVTVKVSKVTVTKGLKITQFLPDAPGEDATPEEKKKHEVLVAHENAHRDLCKEVFDLVSDKIIKDVFKTFPKEFKFPAGDRVRLVISRQ